MNTLPAPYFAVRQDLSLSRTMIKAALDFLRGSFRLRLASIFNHRPKQKFSQCNYRSELAKLQEKIKPNCLGLVRKDVERRFHGGHRGYTEGTNLGILCGKVFSAPSVVRQPKLEMAKTRLHRTEESDAKFDGLLHTTVTRDMITQPTTKDEVSATGAKIEVLNSRLFHQEVEIVRLKAIR